MKKLIFPLMLVMLTGGLTVAQKQLHSHGKPTISVDRKKTPGHGPNSGDYRSGHGEINHHKPDVNRPNGQMNNQCGKEPHRVVCTKGKPYGGGKR